MIEILPAVAVIARAIARSNSESYELQVTSYEWQIVVACKHEKEMSSEAPQARSRDTCK